MFEAVIVWEGVLYVHTANTQLEALDWAFQYAHLTDAAPRVFRVR